MAFVGFIGGSVWLSARWFGSPYNKMNRVIFGVGMTLFFVLAFVLVQFW